MRGYGSIITPFTRSHFVVYTFSIDNKHSFHLSRSPSLSLCRTLFILLMFVNAFCSTRTPIVTVTQWNWKKYIHEEDSIWSAGKQTSNARLVLLHMQLYKTQNTDIDNTQSLWTCLVLSNIEYLYVAMFAVCIKSEREALWDEYWIFLFALIVKNDWYCK